MPPLPELNLELSSYDISAMMRTPLVTSPSARTKVFQSARAGGQQDSALAEAETAQLRPQSTPLSSKEKTRLVAEVDEDTIKPRVLQFDDDEDNDGDEGLEEGSDKKAKDDEQAAATKIQAAWRGYHVRKLFKEACAEADRLVAEALAPPPQTSLEPVDLSWCVLAPLSRTETAHAQTARAAAPSLRSTAPAGHSKYVSMSQRLPSTKTSAPTAPAPTAKRKSSLGASSKCPPLPLGQLQHPKCTFQSSCRGLPASSFDCPSSPSDTSSSSSGSSGGGRAHSQRGLSSSMRSSQPRTQEQQQQQARTARSPVSTRTYTSSTLSTSLPGGATHRSSKAAASPKWHDF